MNKQNNKIKGILLLITLAGIITFNLAFGLSLPHYTENNHAKVSFDISMPIDSTGYILHGENLKGGDIQFTDKGTYVTPYLAHEVGSFKLPVATDLQNKPLIKTKISYNVIKLVNPIGIDNLFVKIGVATRTQIVAGLDPHVLKNGLYTWQVPIFSVGKESNTADNKSSHIQFMQVGSTGGPASSNVMYTQDFNLFLQGNGNVPIVDHPIKSARLNEILSTAHSNHYRCSAQGLWGAGGADPYRTVKGQCQGSDRVFPAGPNLDYVYGTIKLPSVYTPWSASPSDHCNIKGKRHAGCVTAQINLSLHYMAQKIRVPINNKVAIFAEFGTAYRNIMPHNLRYICKSNVYLKNILPPSDCLKKNYLSGGESYPYFAVGYEFKTNNGAHYSARYMNIRGQENGNRLAWLDASNTQIYAISVSAGVKANKQSPEEIKGNFNEALNVIRKMPAVYDVLGKNFFVKILEKNNLYKVKI